MFERFTDRARRVMVLAQEEARLLNHNHIGTEHLPEILGRVRSIDAQLSAIGQRVGAGPAVRDLDERIAQARRDKEAAADAEDYESAAALRDRERQLLADKTGRQQAWASEHLDLASLAEELHRVGEEVGRLRALLGQQGTGPQDGAA